MNSSWNKKKIISYENSTNKYKQPTLTGLQII